MALQSLTTTPTPSGTETVAPTPGPQDTNAFGSDGPEPLVPAFVLSGLLIVGITMMCWWKRLAARRVAWRHMGGRGMVTGMGMRGEIRGGREVGMGMGRMDVSSIGTGRGLNSGIILLAARGAELQMQEFERQQIQHQEDRRRRKEVKLGPRPVLTDVYLEKDGSVIEKELEEIVRWRWKEMKPVSASYVPIRPQSVSPPQTDVPNTIPPSSPNPSRTRRTRTRTRRTDAESKTETRPKTQERERETPPPSLPSLRISVFISMPTPRDQFQSQYSGHSGSGGRKSASSSASSSTTSSELQKEETESLDDDGERGLGDLNLVLGITEVPFDQSKEL